MANRDALYNDSSDTFIAMRVETARTFWKRFVGWMGKRTFREGEALLITPCSRVHTCFMFAPIDVVFLDRDGRVVKILENVRPFRFPKGARRANSVVELPAGTIANHGLQVLDQLRLLKKET
jgi:uncharacterized membrane protein (UPF0127 family)